MARFRKRRRGTWLPILGTIRNQGEGEEPIHVTLRRLSLQVVAGDDGFDNPVSGIVPLTTDEPQEPDEQSTDTHGMGAFINNEYIISRIVGQLFVSRDSLASSPGGIISWPAIHICAGVFVARAADGQSALTDAVPAGWTAAEAGRLYSPSETQNIREPWMWRRSWILGLGVTNPTEASETIVSAFSTFPMNNTLYPNMSDHRVDIKSKRRVRLDERLWLVVTAMPVTNALGNAQSFVEVTADLRIFGNIVKAKNQGSF